jgi:2,4-dienoyl-CoA reductase-like NADH-dependent reductase (Old Yellow Enzyme family)
MQEKSVLFTPIDIGRVTIPNRFVRSATQDYLATQDGYVTDKQIALFRGLAKGGVGLIISGHTYVNPTGKASLNQTAVYDDTFIPGLEKLVKAVHQHPSRIFLQIAHAGRQTKEKISGESPVAPSAVYEPTFKVTPKEMSGSEIQAVIDDFIQGGRRAEQAGFDGIQLHVAHGYLLSGFISPYTNRRNDMWGGSLTNRTRIVTQIVNGIKDITNRDFPVIVKLNSTDLLPDGVHIQEAVRISQILENAEVDGIEVSGGMSEAGKASVWDGPFSEDEEGYFVENAARIKSAVSVPVFGLGGIRTVAVMENMIKQGKVDLVSMSRPFIREPDLVRKIRKSMAYRSACISCNKCFNPRGIACAELRKMERKE